MIKNLNLNIRKKKEEYSNELLILDDCPVFCNSRDWRLK